jgi:hypothetical protein
MSIASHKGISRYSPTPRTQAYSRRVGDDASAMTTGHGQLDRRLPCLGFLGFSIILYVLGGKVSLHVFPRPSRLPISYPPRDEKN